MNIAKRRVIIVLLLALFFCQSWASLTSKSATFDEVQYFGMGKYLLFNHKWDVMGAILHPPLAYYLSSLPLLFADEDHRFWEYDVTDRDLEFLGAVDVYRGQGLLSDLQNANDKLLIASRLMILLLSLVLGYYVYRFSSELFGLQSGILSLFLFSFCPNMLAYSGLIVPDMPLTVFSFIAIYYFWSFLKCRTIKATLIAGIALGLALSTKFTALLLIPVILILTAVIMIKDKKSVLGYVSVILGVAVFILFLGYGFDVMPYFQGISYQLSHANDGHSSFLMGEQSISGWWYYYVVAFLLKTPIPVMLLFVASLSLYFKKSFNNRFDSLFLLLPIIVFFGFFSIMHQSIGIRYILPIYPFVFVFVGSLMAYGTRFRYCIYALSVWYVGASLYYAPHYLAYFNELIGGPDNGYKFLVDSNLDWGQDLKGLKKFMDRNAIKRISLSYFGADSPQRYGIEYDWLPSHHLYNPEPGKNLQMPSDQLIAVSVTNLQGVYFENKDTYRWLQQYEPVAKIGHSIFIYDLRGRGQYRQ